MKDLPGLFENGRVTPWMVRYLKTLQVLVGMAALFLPLRWDDGEEAALSGWENEGGAP